MKLVLVLALRRIPTIDYYLTSRGERNQDYRLELVDGIAALKKTARLGSAVGKVVVRHAPAGLVRWLTQNDGIGSPCAMLMDDDQPEAWRCPDVPLLYGFRTSLRYQWIRRPVNRLCDRHWVSTPTLQERYPGARVVPPKWFGPMPAVAPASCRRWGYHGTQIHHRELNWLVPLVERVQRRVPDAVFEIFGGRSLARKLAHIPRVQVCRTRSWPDYLEYVRNQPLLVGVAPLLQGRFNAARSHTKAFDIMRAGAVGVFSAREPYQSALEGSGALLVDDDLGRWTEHVVRLLNSDAERSERFEQHLDWLRGQIAEPGEIETLFDPVLK